jgi:hypothetical protein
MIDGGPGREGRRTERGRAVALPSVNVVGLGLIGAR